MNQQEHREYVGSVTLMLLGDDLDPAQVSTELGLEPSQCWRRGERKAFTTKDGVTRVFDSEHEWGGWKLLVADQHKNSPIKSQLEFWVGLMRSRIAPLKRLRLLGFDCSLDVFVTSSETASLIIPHKLQSAVAVLGLDLRFSFWAATEIEQAAAGDARNART